ncbi:MAG: hypothetical protein IJ057_03875 [Bacteroidales bacterium]|nr:hypothetical protein [Bacteroidales bacterium]
MSLNLTQYPSGNCFRNKVTEFVMTSTYSVTMSITINPNGQTEEIFTGRYRPDFSGQINVDVTDIVKDYVKSTVPTNANDYAQADFVKEFGYKIEEDNGGSAQGTFKVFNVACNTTESVVNWCAAHFLTHQAAQKYTNYESPEWLTWYDFNGDYELVARFYPKLGGNREITVKSDSEEGCYTVNVCYSRLIRMASILPSHLKGYYDLILFDGDSKELARQRYLYKERSGMERYYVFANALGGVDTIIADGENLLQPELTYNYGRFGNLYAAIDDTENIRSWNQSLTLAWRERNWLWEILSTKGEAAIYDTNAKTYERIIISDAPIKISDKGQLASASFSYLMSEAMAMPVILESEEQSREFNQSAADAAEELHDETTAVVLSFDKEGNGGFETEEVTLLATKLYVEFEPTTVQATVHYSIDGKLAGDFDPSEDTSPVIITKAAGASVMFTSQDAVLDEVVVSYYPITIQSV